MSDVYDRLPKVELHCHLEGTIAPATVAELASKNGHRLPVPRIEDLYSYDSLNGFLEIFWFVQEVLVTPEDWERAAAEAVGRGGGGDGVMGLGMDSTELGVDPRDYAAAFELARSAGLRRTAHAGEDTGPDNIETALAALGVERIDHGLSILQDPELTARVSDEHVPLNVCPNSNVLIANKVPSLAEHPFRRMREAGLLATLNTDDPAMTDLDLGKEYRSVAEALDLSFDGVEATWLEDDDKRRLRGEFEREIDALRVGLAD